MLEKVKTRAEFIRATGRNPVKDDMDRVNCFNQGLPGHYHCGWCKEHDKPRLECGCLTKT